MTPKKAPFKIEELDVKGDNQLEQLRARRVFVTLKEKALKGETLTEHEKDFFCLAIKVSRLNDGVWEDYQCCDNFKFKELYLTYFKDLTGGSQYYKAKNTSLYKVETIEAQRDLDYLYSMAADWENVVLKSNHKEELLQQVAIEARSELKFLSNLPEFTNNPFGKGTFVYKFKKYAILLQSKFTYCIALSIFEKLNSDDFISEINGSKIVFNEYTLIHVLSRHFAEAVKPYITGKSYISKDFKPRLLAKQIKEILTKIDNSDILKGRSLDRISYKYKNIDYLIFTSEKSKFEKGKGEIKYRRIDTFFPVEDKSLKEKFFDNCTYYQIEEEIGIYI